MATKFKLSISTPHGEFTRVSTTPYTHAVVRTCPRAAKSYELSKTAVPGSYEARNLKSGVDARWVKDRGFAVTWHGSEAAARNAASKPYVWDSATGPAEIFPVI